MKHLTLALTLCAVGLAGCLTSDSNEVVVSNADCPYSGRPVNEEFSMQVGNKNLRTCCGDCLEMAKENPEEAVSKATFTKP